MFSELRRAAGNIGRRRAHLDGRAERPHVPERRVIRLHDHLAREDLRIREHLRVVVDRPAGDVVRLEQRQPVRARLRDGDGLDSIRKRLSIQDAAPIAVIELVDRDVAAKGQDSGPVMNEEEFEAA